MNNYDVAIIGAGPGGYVAAIRAAQLGMKTALVESRPTLGGTCLNVGCIPSKALLDSSELYEQMRTGAKRHGIECDKIGLNIAAMQRRKAGIVRKLTGGLSVLMKHHTITVHVGRARLRDRQTIEVEATDGSRTTVGAHSIVLATGSVPQDLPAAPFDGESVISSTEALELQQAPSSLLVVGGGAIGLELGSIWSRLGATVEIVELLPEILAGWDRHVATTLRRTLSRQGIGFRLGARVVGIERGDAGLSVGILTDNGKEESLQAEKILVAVGRRAYSDGLGLEAAGLTLDPDTGCIPVDSHNRTQVEHIYAIGDVVGAPMLAHKAEEEGIAVAETIAGGAGEVNYATIPNVVYTMPEVASVGASEEALKERKQAYRIGSFPFAANGRAMAMDQPDGFAKIMADPESDSILGAHIVGPWASDLIAEIVAVMEFGGCAEDIARIAHAHPTLSEAVREAALGIDGRYLHKK